MSGRRWISAVQIYEDDREWFEVELTQEKWTQVDLADMSLVVGHCWGFGPDGYATRHAFRHEGLILMHRVILGLSRGDPRQADHINRDRLDNRRGNLRVATQAQNTVNSPVRGVSSYRGIYWHARARKWAAQFKIDGKSHHLGYFRDEIDAARAYDRAVLAAWGEYAQVNEVVERNVGVEDVW